MKYPILLASAAGLLLSACQSEEATTDAPATDATEASDTAEAAPAAAAPGDPAAFTAGEAPTPEFMVGTWGEGDACDLPIQFAAGGAIVDGPFDTWAIEDGQLVMGIPDEAVKLGVTVVDADTMEAVREGDSETTILKRCG